MKQTGFCANLRFPAVFCENLRPRNAVIPRKSEDLRKSAKISEKLRISHMFVPFSLSLLFPPEFEQNKKKGFGVQTPCFVSWGPKTHAEQADFLQKRWFGPCRLRGLPTVYRVSVLGARLAWNLVFWRQTLSIAGGWSVLVGASLRLTDLSCLLRLWSLEAQQRYFSYRTMLVAIASQNSFVLVFMGYRTIIARYVAKWGIAPFWGSANLP